MYLLCGYRNVYQPTNPDIHIYGIFNTLDDVFERIKTLANHIKSVGKPWPDNVIYTDSHVFWYKHVDDLKTINTPVRNNS